MYIYVLYEYLSPCDNLTFNIQSFLYSYQLILYFLTIIDENHIVSNISSRIKDLFRSTSLRVSIINSKLFLSCSLEKKFCWGGKKTIKRFDSIIQASLPPLEGCCYLGMSLGRILAVAIYLQSTWLSAAQADAIQLIDPGHDRMLERCYRP